MLAKKNAKNPTPASKIQNSPGKFSSQCSTSHINISVLQIRVKRDYNAFDDLQDQ